MTENEAIETLTLSETEKKIFPMLAPVYEVAVKALEDVQKYRKIEKDLKEHYHANVDIPLLMHHFIETVFEGEKHEGFCLLTNEDREAWEEYKAIGTPEECRAAMEKQTAKKIVRREATDEDIENELREFITRKGMIFQCPTCGCYIAVDGMKNCWECGQKLDWSDGQ